MRCDFTEAEIGELFRDVYNDPLDPSELIELERRTEGWAASLQLVEVSLRERASPEERHQFISSIAATTDSGLFDFLAEEVLDQQPEATRNTPPDDIYSPADHPRGRRAPCRHSRRPGRIDRSRAPWPVHESP